MRYCKKCLQPDTRPNVVFDEEQVCYACRYEESKKDIDWSAREQELLKIAEEAKERASANHIPYDCVIGVSGGKDSTFQAYYVRDKLHLHPLLVNSYPRSITEIGRKNLQNLSNQGFDMISLQTNPKVIQELTRRSFLQSGNMSIASEYAIWASSFIIADRFNIPLIVQGENAALTLGTAYKSNVDGDAFGLVNLDTIREYSSIVFDNVSEDDMFLYRIPDLESLKAKGIRAIWLQYYAKEWSQVRNAEFAVAHGLVGREDDLHDIGRYRRYTALDSDHVIANQMLKYYKFGFGFATDEACYDIREGRLTREEAIKLVKEYDGKCSQKYIDILCSYLNITNEEFWEVVDRFVNRNLFQKDENGKWQPKFEVGVDYCE